MTSLPAPGGALIEHTIPSVTAETMTAMSVVLADPNPIHLDVEAVRAMGLGDRLINQGTTNLAYVMDMVQKNFPDARLERFNARLLSHVFAGDSVTAGGVVESIEQRDDGLRVVSQVWLDVAGGRRAVDGTATVVLV